VNRSEGRSRPAAGAGRENHQSRPGRATGTDGPESTRPGRRPDGGDRAALIAAVRERLRAEGRSAAEIRSAVAALRRSGALPAAQAGGRRR